MRKLRSKIRELFRIRSRFLEIIVWSLVALAVLWVGYGQVGRRILSPIAQRQIGEFTGKNVSIGSIEFKNNGVIYISNLVVGSKSENIEEDLILQAKMLECRFSILSVLTFRPRLKRIIVRDFVLNALYNSDANRWNFDTLNFKNASEGKGRVPFINAEKGILRVAMTSLGKERPLVMVGVDGDFSAAPGLDHTYGFYLEVNESLGFEGSKLRGLWTTEPCGHIELNGRILMGDSPVFGNTWQVNNLKADVDYDEDTIFLNDMNCVIGEESHLSLAGTINDYKGEPSYDLTINLDDITLLSEPKGNCLVYSQDVLDRLTPSVRRFLESYNPCGPGDIHISCAGLFEELPDTKLDGEIICKDVSILYEGFPYQLDHMVGRLEVTEKSALLQNLRCVHGPVELEINGHTKVIDGKRDYDINITSGNMLLDDDLYLALDSRQKQMWFTFTPSGEASIDYRSRRRAGEEREVFLTADLLGTRAVYEHFPYQLENLTGKVSIQRDNISFYNVVSRYDDEREVTISGGVTEMLSERPQFNVSINAKNIPVDSRLKEALPAAQREFYERFDLDATTDVRIDIFPNEVGKRPVEYIAEVTIKDASVVYDEFPLPLRDVDVHAVLTPDLAILKELTGYNGDGRILLAGKVWPADDDNPEPGFCLNLKADGLEVSDDLLNAMPEKERKIASELGVEGTINAFADLNRNVRGEKCPDRKIAIECLGNSFDFTNIPCTMNNVTGTITIIEDSVTFEKIHADDVMIVESAESEGLNIFSGICASVAPAGPAELNIDKAVIVTDESGEKQIDISGNVKFHQSRFGAEDIFSDINGGLVGSGSYNSSAGLIKAEARFQAETFGVKKRLVENILGDIVYDPTRKTFTSTEFKADCYEGKIIGDLEFMPLAGGDVEYSLEASLDGVTMRDMILTKPEDESRAHDLPGTLNGSVSISGLVGNLNSNTGRVDLAISDMELSRSTFFGKVMTAIRFREPTEFIFDNMSVEALVKGTDMIFEQVYLAGRNTLWQGHGVFDLEDDQIDLDLTASGREISPDPSFLESLAKSLGSAVVKVKVQGDVNDPVIESTALGLFRNPLEWMTD